MSAGKVILVNNQKGGVGKTTTAVNLAVGLSYALTHDARGGEAARVLLVDTDPQGCVCTALDIQTGDRCISQLLTEEADYNEVIVPVDSYSPEYAPARPNLWVLPSTLRLSAQLDKMNQDYGALAEIATRVSAGARRRMGVSDIPTIATIFEEALGPLRQAFRYIIIDSAPTVGALTEALFRFADHVIVPTELDFHSVTQTLKHTQFIQHWQSQGAKLKLLCVVPTMYKRGLNLTREMQIDLKKYYGNIAHPIPARTAIATAPTLGSTILEYDPRSDGAKAYSMLVKRVIESA